MTASPPNGPLVIAVPSKGRLQENTAALFARAGLPFVQAGGARGYRAQIGGLPGAEIALLSASEIARELAAGAVHFGVTGLDLVHETVADAGARERLLHLVAPLGFGRADVVVAVPKAWIDVRGMDDLAEVAADFRARHGRRMRVATKFVNLARSHFARHGVVDYAIVESLGATEGAPAAGTAELVVDITTTGATLAANGLGVVDGGLILRSEAHLVAARTADWGEGRIETARAILDRVDAERRGRQVKEVRTRLADPAPAAAAAAGLGAVEPFGPTAPGADLVLHCPAGRVYDCVLALKRHGAATVTVAALEEVFAPVNPLLTALATALGRG